MDHFRAIAVGWAPSRELAGAVAQVQSDSCRRNDSERVESRDEEGNPTGHEAYNFKPRAFIVIGCLKEFITEHGINQDRLHCFELYRNIIQRSRYLLSNEVYERSRLIMYSAEKVA